MCGTPSLLTPPPELAPELDVTGGLRELVLDLDVTGGLRLMFYCMIPHRLFFQGVLIKIIVCFYVFDTDSKEY